MGYDVTSNALINKAVTSSTSLYFAECLRSAGEKSAAGVTGVGSASSNAVHFDDCCFCFLKMLFMGINLMLNSAAVLLNNFLTFWNYYDLLQ